MPCRVTIWASGRPLKEEQRRHLAEDFCMHGEASGGKTSCSRSSATASCLVCYSPLWRLSMPCSCHLLKHKMRQPRWLSGGLTSMSAGSTSPTARYERRYNETAEFRIPYCSVDQSRPGNLQSRPDVCRAAGPLQHNPAISNGHLAGRRTDGNSTYLEELWTIESSPSSLPTKPS